MLINITSTRSYINKKISVTQMILKCIEIKYNVSVTLLSHSKFAILTGVQKFEKNECPFSQIHLLRNNCATNVAQNFFVNYSLLYLQAYIISWLSYLHGKTYKNPNLRNRLRGGMLVIFKVTKKNVEVIILAPEKWL